MMIAVLVAGIGVLLAGLLAIGYGIPIKEFGFGNTLIITGAVAACTGLMMLALWIVVRELKNIAESVGLPGQLHPGTLQSTAPGPGAEEGGFLFDRDQPTADHGSAAEPGSPGTGSPPPWHQEAASRDRGRGDAPAVPAPVEPVPAVKPRRNLLFSSSSRKERERAQARPLELGDLPAPAATPPPPEPGEPPPANFDDAWPKSERSRPADAPLPRRSGRAPSTFTEPDAGAASEDRQPPAPRTEGPPPVTVLKSGVVDGMAYSLYSDGSIEAQMPEGMMRFASIDELRAHLDQRS
jgi:hypothetical protein